MAGRRISHAGRGRAKPEVFIRKCAKEIQEQMLHARTEACDFERSTGLASHQRRFQSLLWIVVCALVLSSVGCKHKPNIPLTQVDVARPVCRDVPVYSEWIGTTVGYIDAQIHSKVTG